MPSVAVIVRLEPAVFAVIEVDPTPLTKASMVCGLMDPVEMVKDGVPT